MKESGKKRISFLRIFAGLILLLGIFIPIPFITGWISFQVSEEKIEKTFESWNMKKPDYRRYSWKRGEIFYAEAGSAEKPRVVLIHGSPGSWDNYLAFFGSPFLRDQVHLIAMDRPGFGKSAGSGSVPSLEVQSQALGPVLMGQRAEQKAILVGHSLGGPVAAQMAVDYPEEVGGLVLVAPSISPSLEALKWYNQAARFPPVKWVLPRSLKHSNEEILPLKAELEKLKPKLAELQIPVVVIQGERDSLVPHQNADFVKKAFTQSRVKVNKYPDLNHFIPWTRPELIENALASLLNPTDPFTPTPEPQL